jgi:DNA modification methylase
MGKQDFIQDHLFEHNKRTGDPSEIYAVDEEKITLLREKLNIIKNIDGYPTASDDDILIVSLPPNYTACPNPFLKDYIGEESTNDNNGRNSVKPYKEDVSVGKSNPLYFAHYYSTKVPPEAIVPYILHYTKPGDIVLDGFCGTGMTGVACQLVDRQNHPNRGLRRAVLVDLSPAATFIAAMTNSISSIVSYLDEVDEIVREVEKKLKYLLVTSHNGWARGEKDSSKRKNSPTLHSSTSGEINYVVWSDVFNCSECGLETSYWDLIFMGPGMAIPKTLKCPKCDVIHTTKTLQRNWVSKYDHELGTLIKQAKQIPVLINYSVGKKRFEKTPDEQDLENLNKLENINLPFGVPIVKTPYGFNTEQPKKSHGFTHVHHFFSRRNLFLISEIWRRIVDIKNPVERNSVLYLFTGAIQRVWKLNRYMPAHDRHVGPLSGTLYVSQVTAEIPVTSYISERVKDIKRITSTTNLNNVIVSTQSTTDLQNIPDKCIDYIFTDPPFGGNLNYSELNVFIEAWLQVYSNQKPEAIINTYQGKSIDSYTALMRDCFREYYRVLKPGRWITVEFHNSENAVWNSIQESLRQAGFIVADVSTLDKQKGTTKQLSYASAVKQDLIISAYKPEFTLEDAINIKNENQQCWDFIRYHLGRLPIVTIKNDEVIINSERQAFLLFDRMVAFYIQHNAIVPISANEFYVGLKQRFIERDGMYFLPEQTTEYDAARLRAGRIAQMMFFVNDEKTAIQWLRQQLDPSFGGAPQTYQDLQPNFLRQLHQSRHEALPELSILLEQNFLIDEQQRWYIPDPSKAGDLDQLRQKALLKEFSMYLKSSGRLRYFRSEAVRAGFAEAYQRRAYDVILQVASRLQDEVLHEDPDLLMYYDTATLRMKSS